MSEPVSESSLHILRIYANAAGGIFPARRGILREIPYGKGVYRLATAFFRTIILYLLLIAGLRLSGKRQIGELEPIELVLTLLISDLASVPMQDFALPLFNGVIPIITLIALSTLFSAISLRNVRFRDLVCGQPALVIVDGKLRQETMRRNRLTLDELFEQLRGQGITDLSDVKYAVLETNGRLSVLPRSPLQPVTPEQLGLDVQDNVFLPIILINDGRVLTDNLRQAGRDDRWLAQELHRRASPAVRTCFCCPWTNRAPWCVCGRRLRDEGRPHPPVRTAGRAVLHPVERRLGHGPLRRVDCRGGHSHRRPGCRRRRRGGAGHLGRPVAGRSRLYAHHRLP